MGTFFTSLLLVIAIGVFGYAAFMLYGYYREYKAGTDEYGNLNDKYVNIMPVETEAGGGNLADRTPRARGLCWKMWRSWKIRIR